jgi:hypothetical protein
MKRRLQINLLKLFASIVLFGSFILITKKNYLPINTEVSILKQEKDAVANVLKEKQRIQKFYEITLPNFQNHQKMGIFLNLSKERFKHQLRHILDDYNTHMTVQFFEPFYDKVFPGLDLGYLPLNIHFSVHDEKFVGKLIRDINYRLSYFINPISLTIRKLNDKYVIDYKVFWIKALAYGDLSNLSAAESAWHFPEP